MGEDAPKIVTQEHNRWLPSSHPIVILPILFAILLIPTYKASSRMLLHNFGVLKYQRYLVGGSNPFDLSSALALMKQAVRMDPDNSISRARLASVYLSTNSYEAAFQEAQLATILSGQQDGSCQMGQTYSVRMFSRLTNYQPTELLDFSHPLSVWHFNVHNGAVGAISIESIPNSVLECIAYIKFDIDQAPDRYIILAQDIVLKPNTTYELSVLSKVEGNFRGWLGIRSHWPGVEIPHSKDWQVVTFAFRSDENPRRDFVHLVINDGHGVLTIHDIRLTIIDTPNLSKITN